MLICLETLCLCNICSSSIYLWPNLPDHSASWQISTRCFLVWEIFSWVFQPQRYICSQNWSLLKIIPIFVKIIHVLWNVLCCAGDLCCVSPLRRWRHYYVLVEKYNFMLKEPSDFSDLSLCMLDYHSKRRATAAECLRHRWLTSD